jgi:hypothetical protein
MVILLALSVLFTSILWVEEPPQHQQQHSQQSQLLPLANIIPTEATNTAANDTSASSNGNNLTRQKQISSGNDTTTASSTGLRIAYPRGWIANDLGNGTVSIMTPLRTDLMRFTVNVVNLPPSLENITLDKIVDLNLNSSKQQLSNFSLVESNTTTISPENQSARKIVYTNNNKDPNFPLKFKTMQIITIRDGQAYTISYVSEDSQYLRHLSIIERMINSISFEQRQ